MRADQVQALFEAQRRQLWGLAYRLTGSAADADDVVQETFARLVAQPPARDAGELGPWLPLLWRYHRIHHMDPAVDVTTTIRQHPAEGLIRYAFLTVFGVAVGANLLGFAIYRTVSLFNSLLEHANIRLPARVDAALSWITTWPNLHKIHHSRVVAHTDSNYANMFSLWDRLFGTFTPSRHGATVPYGLDGCDDPAEQTTVRLLTGAAGGRPPRAPAAPLPGAAR